MSEREEALAAARRINLWNTQGTDIDVPIEYRIDALRVARALILHAADMRETNQ